MFGLLVFPTNIFMRCLFLCCLVNPSAPLRFALSRPGCAVFWGGKAVCHANVDAPARTRARQANRQDIGARPEVRRRPERISLQVLRLGAPTAGCLDLHPLSPSEPLSGYYVLPQYLCDIIIPPL